MKIFRAISLVLVSFIGILVAIQPQIAKASVLTYDSAQHYYIASAPYRSTNPVNYKVKADDTLSSIAISHSITWQSVYCENESVIGANPDVIMPGEWLKISTRVYPCRIIMHTEKPVTNSLKASTKTTPVSTQASSTSQESLTQVQQYALNLLGGNEQEYSCLNNVIMVESGWNTFAENPSSGAYGIPQALPGYKMDSAGSDWATNPDTQLRWMIDDYIPSSYGSACGAWEHEETHGWY